MGLTQIADDVWGAEGEVSPAPGMRMATRMTVVRKPNGGILVHSPIELSEALATEIDALGRVEDLVSPNLFHHLFLRGAMDRWPEAQFHSSPGLKQKRSDLPAAKHLEARKGWQDVFLVLPVEGMPKFQEFAFLHEPSRTLIVTDLVFNEPRGFTFSSRLFFRLFGTFGKLAVSRLFTSMVKDRQAFAASLRKLSQLEFERVVMAHGNVLEENAQQRFREVLSSHAAG